MTQSTENLCDELASLSPEKTAVVQAALAALQQADGPMVGFVQLLGVQFEEFGAGRCRSSLEIRSHLLNPLGIGHGGVTFALADTSCGLAALSVLPNPGIVTQDMQIRYHGPARRGRLTCLAEVVYKGSRTITTQAQLTQGDTLVATVSGTFAILNADEKAQISQ